MIKNSWERDKRKRLIIAKYIPNMQQNNQLKAGNFFFLLNSASYLSLKSYLK